MYSKGRVYDVTIPNSVTSIGNSAFESCSSLFRVYIGNLLESIGDNAFKLYGNLEAVDLTIHSQVLECASKNVETLKSITIPDSVTSIGNNAFKICRKLETVNLPNSLTSLGSHVFENVRNLVHQSLYQTQLILWERNIFFVS